MGRGGQGAEDPGRSSRQTLSGPLSRHTAKTELSLTPLDSWQPTMGEGKSGETEKVGGEGEKDQVLERENIEPEMETGLGRPRICPHLDTRHNPTSKPSLPCSPNPSAHSVS